MATPGAVLRSTLAQISTPWVTSGSSPPSLRTPQLAQPGPALYPLSYMSLIMIGATALVAYDLARQLRADEAEGHAPWLLETGAGA